MTTTKCPCCGQALDSDLPAQALGGVPLPNSQRKLLDAVLRTYPRPAPTFVQVDAVWGDRADGGPDGNLPKHLAVLAHKINDRIRPYGWEMRGQVKKAFSGRYLKRIEQHKMFKETLTQHGETLSL